MAIRLNWGKLYADILRDERGAKAIWMYVVQRAGSPEILAMGSCRTRRAAEKFAEETMRELAFSFPVQSVA